MLVGGDNWVLKRLNEAEFDPIFDRFLELMFGGILMCEKDNADIGIS
jgi:hypothetical protein